MKVLHLISSEGYYGAENVVVSLARSLPQFGFSCTLGVFVGHPTTSLEIVRRAREQGIPVTGFQCDGRVDWRTVRLIRQYARKEQTDLVHTHGYKADLYGYAALRSKLPLVSTCHGWTSRSPSVRLYQALSRKVLRRFDGVIGVSEEIGRTLRQVGVSRGRVTIIDNGIDTSEFRDAEPTLARELNKGSRLMVGTVGRLSVEKGPRYLIQAAVTVLAAFPETLFVLVGDGPQKQSLHEQLARLTLEDRVILAGSRERMPGVYASLDVFLLPSLTEGTPVALLEAMASSLPVVATRVGGSAKVIEHETNGLLVEPGDTSGLAQAVSALLRDAALRRQLGTRARATVEMRFSARIMASKYSEVYERVRAASPRLRKTEAEVM